MTQLNTAARSTPAEDDKALPIGFRKRRTLHLPITLSVSLMTLNVALMICWIVLLARYSSWGPLTIGVVAFALILVGLSIYLVLTIKEIQLNRRQSNFIDSVTHELKSPIASLKLYLDTLQMRELDRAQQTEFLRVMRVELDRLDKLITHLLEVARLDAIGQETEAEAVQLSELIEMCARSVAAQRDIDFGRVFKVDSSEITVYGRRTVMEMIFSNLLENAIKYGGEPPEVIVRIQRKSRHRALVRVIDNGQGIPPELRSKIFKIFYRGGSELERTQTGTGLGLYIVKTLVMTMKGRVQVNSRSDRPGSSFDIEIPAIPEEKLEGTS